MPWSKRKEGYSSAVNGTGGCVLRNRAADLMGVGMSKRWPLVSKNVYLPFRILVILPDVSLRAKGPAGVDVVEALFRVASR
jgi:hypothetical protein